MKQSDLENRNKSGPSDATDEFAAPQSPVRNPRLTLRIGLFYTLLAVTNIIFFSIMIFENQTDLLQTNFRHHSDSIVRTVLGDLEELRIRRKADESIETLQRALAPFDIQAFVIFDRSGAVWHRSGADSESRSQTQTQLEPAARAPRVDAELRTRADLLVNQELVFRARYSLVLNEDDFSVDLLLPLSGVSERGPEKIFLNATLSVREMQARLNALYYQVAIAVVWGVAFHLVFAIFVYRLIFRRLNALKSASLRMAAGDLKARANFTGLTHALRSGGDELDELGASFNSMASGIQDKVETISEQITTIRGLNDTIQLEMRIGKEVQESFTRVSPEFQAFRPAVFYQPLREVSGDIYNFYKLKGESAGTHALFFADATGHGVSAALITAIVTLSLEELLRNADLFEIEDGAPGLAPAGTDPIANPQRTAPDENFAAQIMTKLNQTLAGRLNPFFHATALVLLFQADGEIIFSSAGHTPCYAVRPSTGEVLHMNAHATPLGMVADMSIECERLPTRPGDKLLIYSDGYTEAHDGAGGEEYTRERALALFQESAQLPPDEIMRRLKTDLFAHTEHFNDDVAILVLEIPAAKQTSKSSAGAGGA